MKMGFKGAIISNLIGFKRSRKASYDRSRITKLQAKRWDVLQHELKQSPFYAQLSNEGAALNSYPVINKEIFMAQLDNINTAGIKKNDAFKVALNAETSRDFSSEINGVTIGLSTGTSGNRGIFMANEKERAKWVAAILDRVIGFQLKKRKVAFFLRSNSELYESVNSSILDFKFFDLIKPEKENLALLAQYQPNILVAQPSVLKGIADAVVAKELLLNTSKIISVAEVLDPADKAYFEATFKQKIHQVYQCTEGFLAATCEEGVLHFNEDFLIIERNYLDETKNRFHPIITDLYRTTQPVVRYELNDIIIEKESCKCGRKTLAIEQIEGRSDDVMRFINNSNEEVNIYPDFVRRNIVKASDDIKFYAATQIASDHIEVYLESSNRDADFDKVQHHLAAFLADQAINAVKISLAETFQKESMAKLRRIRNEYSKKN
jgi:putative adenylate-forming enzyme